MYASLWGRIGMILRTYTFHFGFIIVIPSWTRITCMGCEIVILRMRTDCTILTIEIRIFPRAISTDPICDFIDLLIWTMRASQIRKIPKLRMITFNASLFVPELVVSLIT